MEKPRCHEQIWKTKPTKKFPKGQRIRIAIEQHPTSKILGTVLGMRVKDGKQMFYKLKDLIKE